MSYRSMAANIAGAMFGGLLEYSAMMIGFRGVIVIIIGCYLVAGLSAAVASHHRG